MPRLCRARLFPRFVPQLRREGPCGTPDVPFFFCRMPFQGSGPLPEYQAASGLPGRHGCIMPCAFFCGRPGRGSPGFHKKANQCLSRGRHRFLPGSLQYGPNCVLSLVPHAMLLLEKGWCKPCRLHSEMDVENQTPMVMSHKKQTGKQHPLSACVFFLWLAQDKPVCRPNCFPNSGKALPWSVHNQHGIAIRAKHVVFFQCHIIGFHHIVVTAKSSYQH